jgi:hypothetical protein
MTKKTSPNKLGIIVPYRNRYKQLVLFKRKITEYMTNRGIDYELIVVEQDDAKLFNRGMLLNIGFEESLKLECNYVVFHDIDMLPLKVDYTHSNVPVHLATDFLIEDKNFKRDIFDQYFGGVTIFPSDVFKLINGYSNEYWGWGFEDDDLFKRCCDRGVPFDTLVRNVEGGGDSALKFNGVDSYAHSNFQGNLESHGLTIMITMDADPIVCNPENGYDRYTALSIPEIELTISYDSFRRYKVLMKDGKEWASIDSKIEHDIKKTLVVTINQDRKIITMYQDGKLIGSTKYKKNLKKSEDGKIFIGSKNEEEELFKGTVSQVAIYRVVIPTQEIEPISKNTKYSLTRTFDGYTNCGELVHYFDMRYVVGYDVVDLSNRENVLTLVNCETVLIPNEREVMIKVPFRKRGYFDLQSHESSGYKDGAWTDVNIRYNQLRFHNEMDKGYRNPNEDGLSNLKYEIWNRTKRNNQTQLTVGI